MPTHLNNKEISAEPLPRLRCRVPTTTSTCNKAHHHYMQLLCCVVQNAHPSSPWHASSPEGEQFWNARRCCHHICAADRCDQISSSVMHAHRDPTQWCLGTLEYRGTRLMIIPDPEPKWWDRFCGCCNLTKLAEALAWTIFNSGD